MRCIIGTAFCALFFLSAKSQVADSIIAELKAINQLVVNTSCGSGNGMAISNRAMNIFFADKTGYLSESDDLSLYTNYVTLNTTEGKLAINHNFQKATGLDEPIKKLLSVGISANVANSFAATFLDKKFENELGLTVNYKWLHKVKTHFSACSQKHSMDLLRSTIVHSLEVEINKKATNFLDAINKIDSGEIPGQNIAAAKSLAIQNFYNELKETYEEEFATLQAEKLTQTNNFSQIATAWTSFTVYIPLVFPTYTIASTLASPFIERHPYPLELRMQHTRLWESSKNGRLFFTIGGNLLFNNGKLSYTLDKTDVATYKNLGGTDTIHLAQLNSSKAYIGNYSTFVTPSLTSRLVYYPPSSHIGISFLIEQRFGKYNLLNGRLGIPIVLINRKKTPAANFEFYVHFFDMSHSISLQKKYGNKTSIGLGIGIPFSRLMY
jgi:hypothetical protein